MAKKQTNEQEEEITEQEEEISQKEKDLENLDKEIAEKIIERKELAEQGSFKQHYRNIRSDTANLNKKDLTQEEKKIALKELLELTLNDLKD